MQKTRLWPTPISRNARRQLAGRTVQRFDRKETNTAANEGGKKVEQPGAF